jgi:hypothetical protein
MNDLDKMRDAPIDFYGCRSEGITAMAVNEERHGKKIEKKKLLIPGSSKGECGRRVRHR